MTFKERLGIALVIFSIASMVMWFVGLNFRIFFWIDMMGPEMGWVIRVLMAALGIYVYRTGDEID